MGRKRSCSSSLNGDSPTPDKRLKIVLRLNPDREKGRDADEEQVVHLIVGNDEATEHFYVTRARLCAVSPDLSEMLHYQEAVGGLKNELRLEEHNPRHVGVMVQWIRQGTYSVDYIDEGEDPILEHILIAAYANRWMIHDLEKYALAIVDEIIAEERNTDFESEGKIVIRMRIVAIVYAAKTLHHDLRNILRDKLVRAVYTHTFALETTTDMRLIWKHEIKRLSREQPDFAQGFLEVVLTEPFD